MVTLDGDDRTFTADDLLICDADDRPIGIGGVMGGLDTEITDTTTTVVLEIAWFQQLTVLQSSARLGLRSEASARYERGCDPYIIDTALARFVELLRETCPDLIVHAGMVDERGPGMPEQQRSTTVRTYEVNRILGTELTGDDLPPLLDPIGFEVAGDGDARTVAIPSWRPDCEAEVDVIEEIARHYGYERLGKTVPKSTVHGESVGAPAPPPPAREVLLGLGISEAMPNPFLAPGTLAKAGLEGPTISITNPLVVEESVLRTSLRPGMLDAIAYNESHRRTGVRLFEIGHVYPPGSGELPDEYEALCVVLAGEDATERWPSGARSPVPSASALASTRTACHPGLHATRSATLQAGKHPTGAIGEIDPGVLQRFGVTERVAILELNLDEILDREPKPAVWKPVSRMPSSDLDLAFVLPDDVPADKLDRAIRQGAGKLLSDLVLFDVFRGASLGDGRRSLAYRLRLQADDRNLTDADVADVRRSAVVAAAKLGAELRG